VSTGPVSTKMRQLTIAMRRVCPPRSAGAISSCLRARQRAGDSTTVTLRNESISRASSTVTALQRNDFHAVAAINLLARSCSTVHVVSI